MVRRWTAISAVVLGSLVAAPAAAQGHRLQGETPSSAPSDHEMVSGHLALGFIGTRQVPASGVPTAGAVSFTDEGNVALAIEAEQVSVPLFGARYWFNRRIALELGIGFNVAGGNETQELPNADSSLNEAKERALPSTLAVATRVSAPISVFQARHLNLMLIPELDFGYAARTIEAYQTSTDEESLDLRLSGLVFGLGARVGSEFSFGFIGVPQLSLQTAFGVRFESRRRRGQIGDAETVANTLSAGTSWYDDPWEIFAGSISAYYYFL